MVNLKICFNSGATDEFIIRHSDNISFLEIHNADQSYYRDAMISLFGIDELDDLDLNTPIRIWIDDSLEFDGYVSRIEKSIKGVRVYTLQCIGRTYDLWRYSISSSTTFTNKKSAYIVSSLVSTYIPSSVVSPPNVSPDDGTFVKNIDLSNMAVGDAIARLSAFDGYKFYVDNTGKLNYYMPASTTQFTITEDNIVSMSPIEYSDDYLRNEVIVIGALEYEEKTPSILRDYVSGQHYYISTSTRYIAQKFRVPTTLLQNRLSAIKLLVKRSQGENIPNYLLGEIREDNSNEPGSVVPSGDTIMWKGTDVLYNVSGNWLPYFQFTSPNLELTPGSYYWMNFKFDGASSNRYWILTYYKASSLSDDFTNDPQLTETWDYSTVDYGKVEWNS